MLLSIKALRPLFKGFFINLFSQVLYLFFLTSFLVLNFSLAGGLSNSSTCIKELRKTLAETYQVNNINLSVFRSDIGKYILTSTQQGRDILSTITGIPNLSSADNAFYAYRLFLQKIGPNELEKNYLYMHQKWRDVLINTNEGRQHLINNTGIQSLDTNHDVVEAYRQYIKKFGKKKVKEKVLSIYESSRDVLVNSEKGKKLLANLSGINDIATEKDALFAYEALMTQLKNKDTELLGKTYEKISIAQKYMDQLKIDFPELYPKKAMSVDEEMRLQVYANTHLKMAKDKIHDVFKKPRVKAEEIFSENGYRPFKSTSELYPISKNLRGKIQAENFFEEMSKCVKSMPQKEKRKQSIAMALQQLGVTEAFTVSAYVAASGGKKVDWSNLPVEMGVGAAAAVIEPIFAVGKGSALTRYLKMSSLGVGKAGIEGTFYYFNPLNQVDKETLSKMTPEEIKAEEEMRKEVALNRGEYSTSWAAGSSIFKMGFFNLLMGLQCLYPNNKMSAIGTSLQFAYRGLSSYGYFTLRNVFIKPNHEVKKIEK